MQHRTNKSLLISICFIIVALRFVGTLSATTNVCGSVSGVWTTTGSPYVATCSITVDNGNTLTINAGVTVKFASGTQLLINGKLLAVGTSNKKIMFTSNLTNPPPGSWRSIYFSQYSDVANSRLSYANITYGGASDPGAVTMNGPYTASWTTIDHLTISNSSSNGIYVGNGNYITVDSSTISNCTLAGIQVDNARGGNITNSTLSSNGTYGANYTNYGFGGLSSDTISNNANYAIGADSTAGLNYLTSLTLTGNGGGNKNSIGLRGGYTGGTWHTGAIYEVLGPIDVPTALSIDPGVTLKFAPSAQLLIDGKLTAIGTASNPITFTSNAASPTAGSWRSIYFSQYSDVANSRLSYANITYGGASDPGAVTMNGPYTASWTTIDHLTISNSSSNGIYIGNGNYITVDSSTISNCTLAGIQVDSARGGTITNSSLSSNGTYGANYTNYGFGGLSSDTISNNANYAIGADSTASLNYLTSLTLTGNGGGNKNSIGLRGGDTGGTWHAGATWEVLGPINVPTALSIDPGVTLKFAPGANLFVYGTLLANGTAAAPITFTSNLATPSNGSWLGIYFQSSNSNSQISNATVAYAGASPYNGAIVMNNCAATITSVTIKNSANYGVQVAGNTAIYPVITKGMFASNTRGGIINENGFTFVDATLTYWNDSTGPSGVAPGSGQSVSSRVKYDPWLTATPTNPHFFSSVTVTNQRFNASASVSNRINFTTSTPGNWIATYMNSLGTTVRTFSGPGPNGSVVWDGRDQSGTLLLDGTYFFLLQSTSNANETAAPVKGTVIIDSTSQLLIQNLTSSPQYFSPNGDGIQDSFTLSASFTFADVNWTINMRNSSGTVLRTAAGQGISVTYVWDGKDSSNVLQPDGVYTAELLVTDGTLSASGSQTVTLDNTFPVSVISSPSQNTILSNVYQNANSIIPVVASINDLNFNNWILDYGTGSVPTSWTVLMTGTSSQNSSTIYSWDTIGITNGQYTMRLQAWDRAGNRTQFIVTITVGNFSMSMDKNDFSVANNETVTYTSVIPFALTETIQIKDKLGNVVRTLQSGVSRTQGSYPDSWNGKTASGAFLPEGAYYYTASVSDGTHSMNWDLTGHYTGNNYYIDDSFRPAWNPFNNNPITFSFTLSHTTRVRLAFSPTYYPLSPHGLIPASCDPPNFCYINWDYFSTGPHAFTWAGTDDTGAYRPDMKGYSLHFYESVEKNVVIVVGTKPVITADKITVTPALFYPEKGPQVISFTVSSIQNQPLNGTIKFRNLDSLSVLRTITLTNQSLGNVSTNWDGKADNGMWVAPGPYSVTLELLDSIGNKITSQILTTVRY